MFNIVWGIRGVPGNTRLKLRLLATARGVPVSRIIEELVDEAWKKDKTKVSGKQKRNAEKIVGKYYRGGEL